MEYPDYDDIELFLEDQQPDWTQLLEQSNTQHQRRLEDELDRIEDQLNHRDQIHEDTVDELKSKLDWYIQRLEKLYRHSFSQDDQEKQRLKNQIDRFYDELRTEKRQHWNDKQELEKERRELIKTLDEAHSSDRLIQNL